MSTPPAAKKQKQEEVVVDLGCGADENLPGGLEGPMMPAAEPASKAQLPSRPVIANSGVLSVIANDGNGHWCCTMQAPG